MPENTVNLVRRIIMVQHQWEDLFDSMVDSGDENDDKITGVLAREWVNYTDKLEEILKNGEQKEAHNAVSEFRSMLIRVESDRDIRRALASSDGSDAQAISMVTGVSVEEINDLGGLPEEGN